MRAAILGLTFLSAVACSPAQRTVVGGGVAVVGLAVTTVAVTSMARSCDQRAQSSCSQNFDSSYNSNPSPPETAIPVALGGLGVAILGGVIMASSSDRNDPSHGSSSPPMGTLVTHAAPQSVAALDPADAVGMAIAHLVLVGMAGFDKPPALSGVDDKQSRLSVQGRYAELSNLRVQTTASQSWLTLHACYEFETEWRLISLSTLRGCSAAP
jgi:hypothetical protein